MKIRHIVVVSVALSSTAFVRADAVGASDVIEATGGAVPVDLTDRAAVRGLDASVETRSIDQCAALPGSTDMALMGLGVAGMLFRRLRP